MTSQELGDEEIARLAHAETARRLRWLNVAVNKLTAKGLEMLAGSPPLKGLVYLELRGNAAEDPLDRFWAEGDVIHATEVTPQGAALERKFGRLEWLHAPERFGVAFPPSREAAIDVRL